MLKTRRTLKVGNGEVDVAERWYGRGQGAAARHVVTPAEIFAAYVIARANLTTPFWHHVIAQVSENN